MAISAMAHQVLVENPAAAYWESNYNIMAVAYF